MTLVTNINLSFQATQTQPADLATGVMELLKSIPIQLLNGTGAGLADQIWHDRRTLAASGTEDLDLGGVLTDMLTGAALTFARIKAVLVYALPANTNNVNFTRPGAAGVPLFLAAGDGLPVKPGGLFLWVAPDAAGIVVTATSADLLTATNSAGGTAVTYDVILIGASA